LVRYLSFSWIKSLHVECLSQNHTFPFSRGACSDASESMTLDDA
jgi:hypothetical protein